MACPALPNAAATEEKRARAIFAGQKLKLEPSDLSLTDYLNGQDWRSAQGVRKFVDNKGNFWLLSISSEIIEGLSGSAMSTTINNAQLDAQRQLVYSLYADASSKQKAKEKMQEIAGKDKNTVEIQTASNFSKELRQSFSKLPIQGMSEVHNDEIIHTISGQEVYLSVYGISKFSNAPRT